MKELTSPVDSAAAQLCCTMPTHANCPYNKMNGRSPSRPSVPCAGVRYAMAPGRLSLQTTTTRPRRNGDSWIRSTLQCLQRAGTTPQLAQELLHHIVQRPWRFPTAIKRTVPALDSHRAELNLQAVNLPSQQVKVSAALPLALATSSCGSLRYVSSDAVVTGWSYLLSM